jgi:hypothetical protein
MGNKCLDTYLSDTVCPWINFTNEGIVNYKGDFEFSLENLAWANSIKEGIVN